MFRIPKWSIVAFVFCAVVAAYFVHSFFSSAKNPHSGSGNYASKTISVDSVLDGSSTPNSIAVAVGEIPEKLQQLSGKAADDCQCTVAGVGSPDLELETPEQCGPHRLMYESTLGKLPSILREEQAKGSADFPRTCITYIMHRFLQGTEKADSSFYANCKSPTGMPARGNYKPCITSNYVNSVYNSFADMTACMGVPQRDYLPKLFNESGFHLNVLGSGYDAGVNQLVGPTIAYANEEFKNYQKQVLNSDSEACRRIAPMIKKLTPASSEVSHRCELISPPNNPLLNIFYMTIKYQQDLKILTKNMVSPRYDIVNRLTRMGLPPEKYDHNQLTQIMMILGFNSGINGALVNLRNYLVKVETSGRKLTLDDFNFAKESSIYVKVSDENHSLVRRSGDDAEKWKARMKSFSAQAEKLKSMNMRYKPKVEKITLASRKWGKYSTYHLNFKDSELSFAAYLQLYQGSGASGYLTFVRRLADELNSVFKEGTCVPDSYLAL